MTMTNCGDGSLRTDYPELVAERHHMMLIMHIVLRVAEEVGDIRDAETAEELAEKLIVVCKPELSRLLCELHKSPEWMEGRIA